MRSRLLGIFIACLAVFGGVGLSTRVAWAQEAPKAMLVVDVAADTPEIDAAALRAAIATELGVDALPPGDARAPEGAETVRVSIDRAPRELVVAYEGGEAPITRRIALPEDGPAIERAAVLLAGNLARKEGDELAASLRKAKPAPPPSSDAIQARRDLDTLGEMVAAGRKASHVRRAVEWALLGAGGMMQLVAPIVLSPNQAGYAVLSAAGDALILSSSLLLTGDFDALAEAYEDRGVSWPREARDDLEARWLAEAGRERTRRRIVGWSLAVLGTASAGISAALAVHSLQESPPESIGSEAIGIGAGAAGVAIGMYLATTPGLLETTLHDYERATGRAARAPATVAWRPVFVPAPGGGMVGVGGTF